ncbi:amidohydrolase family protein [Paratissierella segnis]|jgi:hypothetical protein|uniref:Amidohydrolase n=1 Tax=Paratissierella segnis TaxID=2763679 RepID=A0A926IJN9_9FIRM|nr:amidohydrolase family protein [Paratissierella segnis]MBC8587445.1 amidohydrolase [Paratissierella segnis]
MIIDFHVHIREGRGEVKEFLKGMDANNIDMAVVHPIVPGSDDLGYSDNKFVGKLVKQYPDRLMGFACVVPYEEGAADELERAIVDYNLKGLKLHPPIQNFSLEDPCMSPLIEKCIELDVPILIHTGPINSRTSRMALASSLPIDDLAIRYPEAKFVIAHGDPFGIDPTLVAKHENVYMDTTIVFSEYVEAFPQIAKLTYKRMRKNDRIIFGTDTNPLRTYRFAENLNPLLSMDIPKEDKDLLFAGNAKRLLKIE